MTPYKVIRSNRRTLSISINENAELIVRAPHQLSMNKIHDFINEKKKWVNRQQKIVNNRLSDSSFDKDMALLLGSLYPIKVKTDQSKKITFNGEEFLVRSSDQELIHSSLKKWYKKKFREVAIPRLTYFADKYNLSVNQVRIKEQKTLWGSCSSRNNINLNYLLIMAPMNVIDYVIIHELAHTTHRNHSSHFWKTVESMMPNFKEAKTWLKDYGYKLRKL
ncbi:SprT family zinc-dependent metalloprotease [Candidatus Pseudothioglobus singularis]|nr:SprT family zinc-dependent metalloprotease [Candidatus Pseudothioglobus singularis]